MGSKCRFDFDSERCLYGCNIDNIRGYVEQNALRYVMILSLGPDLPDKSTKEEVEVMAIASVRRVTRIGCVCSLY